MKKIIGIFICILLIITIIPVSGKFIDIEKDFNMSEFRTSSNVINDFDQQIEIFMKLGRIPSLSTCIIVNESIVWSNSYGYADISQQKSTTTDTEYMVASISKTFAATGILQLYEQGYFNLDDDVNDYLPFEFRNPNYPDEPITFRMLLAHQSSFCYNVPVSIYLEEENLLYRSFMFWVHYKDLFKSDFFEDDIYPWIKEIVTPEGMYYNSGYWGNFPPGEQFYYSGIGYALLGYLLELFSNQSFGEYCREHIFEPLSMHNTSFYIDDLNEDNFAIPYFNMKGFFVPLPQYEYNSFNPAAGLYTTVNDLSHFLIAHMNGGVFDGVRILEQDTINEMHSIQYPESQSGFGLGWAIGNSVEGHSGSNMGYLSFMYSLTDENKGFIMFINENNWEGYGLLLNGIYEKIESNIRGRLINLIWLKTIEFES